MNQPKALVQDLSENEKFYHSNKEKFEYLFKNMSTGVVYHAANGKIVSANRSAARILGLTMDQLLGKTTMDPRWKMIHEDGTLVDGTMHPSMIALKTGKKIGPVVRGVFHPEKDTYLWLQISATPLFKTGTTSPYQVFVTFDDISDRVKAEKRYQSLFTNAQVALFRTGITDGKLYEINKQYAEMAGYSSIEECMANFNASEAWVVPDERLKLIQELREKGHVSDFETQIVRKDGSVIYILFSATIYPNKGFIEGSIVDITKRKAAEDEITVAHQRLRTILDKMDALVYVADMETYEILFANHPLKNQVGEVEGKICWKALHPEQDGPCDFCTNQKLFDENGNLSGVYRWEHFNSSVGKWYACQDMGITWTDDRIVKLEIATDINERKNSEAAILKNQVLSAMGEIAYGVAHDFNNSLQGIFGNLELASMENLSDDALKYIKTAKSLASDAASRVKQLQFYGKKSNDPTNYISINICDVVNESIEQTRHLWKDESEKLGITIKVTASLIEDRFILGNQAELRSVFYNIIKNSIQAMPDGGIIDIKAKDDGNFISLTFSDTGIGMKEYVKQHVFRPFFSTKGFEQGKGLGLSIAYSIIRDHKGELNIISTAVGKGSTFEIRLPLSTHQKPPLNKVTTKLNANLNILWVDDEKSILNYGKVMLSQLGNRVEVALSAERALKLLEDHSYDLLITDIGMPGMNGWQLADQVKGKYPKMKIAVVTGWGDYISNEQKIKSGVSYLLGKPISKDEIQDIINSVITMKGNTLNI
ncbi:Sensor histidine kinase RcsC [Candidatus Lokiarchaeum ossiferum]|uniref:Sensor histidine kinase RcsC n=1 Tax=Candidatus Lokiarchaeum ossiferum TaxID=2951803 RepID=A0ABY6HSD8_9ARCH|nr:Sensor histidine kinase RcsC [Candidatus Lokiarchaeum sp. B-35]